MEDDSIFLRVHSKDLHEHIAREIGDCYDTSLYTDLMIRCKNGITLHAHKLVLGAISPYFKVLLFNDSQDIQSFEFPETESSLIQRLLEVIYNGSVEGTLEEMRALCLLAHSLYIYIPLSSELLNLLNLELPALDPCTTFLSSSSSSSSSKRKEISKIFSSLSSVPHIKASENPLESSLIGSSHEFLCPICNSTYSNMGNFKQHMRRHDNESEERDTQMKEYIKSCYDSSKSTYTCSLCLSTYSHSGNFKQHVSKHERESQTQICKSLTTHGNHHLSDVLYSALSGSTGASHLNESSFKPYVCSHCHRSFKHPGNFKQHCASHSRVNSLLLHSVKSDLSIVSESPESKIESSQTPTLNPEPSVLPTRWKCTHCTLKATYFQSREKLRQHVAANHRSTSQFLKRSSSEPIETPNKQCFPMKKCHTYNESEVLLQNHLQLHQSSIKTELTSPKSYPLNECHLCHQIFDSEIVLRGHLQLHHSFIKRENEDEDDGNDVPPFECEIKNCVQSFSSKDWLRKHYQTCHEEKSLNKTEHR